MAGIQIQIKDEIVNREGTIFFPEDFMHLGSPEAVHMALSRLVKEGEIVRLAKGIYLRPRIDGRLGPLMPSVDEIARAIAKKENVTIRATGAYALNKLGLSTQVPTRAVFLTEGHPRSIRLKKGSITFKQTTPKKLGAKNERVFLASQAIQAMGENIDAGKPEFDQLLKALKGTDPAEIRADARYAPQRVSQTLYQLADKLEQHE